MSEVAEGKGPKQIKLQWPVGQFVTNYGNGNQTYNTVTSIGPNNSVGGTIVSVPASNSVNPASVPYPQTTTGSGSSRTWSQVPNATPGKPGGIAPGLNINVNGNGPAVTGYIVAPSPGTAITDIEAANALISIDTSTTWSGTAIVTVQGTFDRLTGQTSYGSPNWVNITSGTITNAGGPPLTLPLSSGTYGSYVLFNAYRLTASGTTTSTSGILNWSIPGCFVDISAMSPIFNSHLSQQPGIGQLNLTDPRIISLASGLANSQGALGQSNQNNIDSGPGFSNPSNNTNYVGTE